MDPRSLEAIVEQWKPTPGWFSTIEDAWRTLKARPALPEALDAWAQLAMVFGDSGAPEFCAVVSLFAESLVPAASADARVRQAADRLASHANMALLDLDMADSTTGPTFPIREAATVICRNNQSLASWLSEFLSPVDSTLKEGAAFALRLAAIRAKLLRGPSPTVFSVKERRHWSEGRWWRFWDRR